MAFSEFRETYQRKPGEAHQIYSPVFNRPVGYSYWSVGRRRRRHHRYRCCVLPVFEWLCLLIECLWLIDIVSSNFLIHTYNTRSYSISHHPYYFTLLLFRLYRPNITHKQTIWCCSNQLRLWCSNQLRLWRDNQLWIWCSNQLRLWVSAFSLFLFIFLLAVVESWDNHAVT